MKHNYELLILCSHPKQCQIEKLINKPKGEPSSINVSNLMTFETLKEKMGWGVEIQKRLSTLDEILTILDRT